MAAAGVPWRTEPLAYRSDLGDRLPDGLTMPRALGVFDLDELSAAIWLEEIHADRPTWDLDRFRRAAYLLGRLAGQPPRGRAPRRRAVRLDDPPLRRGPARRPGAAGPPRRGAVAPPARRRRLRRRPARPGCWRRPTASARYADELLGYPRLSSHGDASPNNLLAGPTPDAFVLIDYGFWLGNPVGFDLGQLLVGDVQIGRRSPDLLAETDEAIVPAYVDGLHAEGCDLDERAVRRAHALHLLIFTGLSTLPFELLDQPPTPELHATAAARAAIARFSLDLLDATGG